MTVFKSVHQQDIEKLVSTFNRNASHLFSVTRPLEFCTYFKGTYGTFFLKPIPRIRQLLGADRELLVVATTFTDLQPRTNKLAVDIIDASDGRLERTVAVVIHQDPNGNSKLKNWGRDVGLTVIPVQMSHSSTLTGDALEGALFSEFYSYDPFEVSGPVFQDSQFYGRRDEAQDLARQLQQGQVRACLGIRKSGKTSVLHRVLREISDYHDSYSVVIDCSKDDVWNMRAGDLLGAIAEAVAASVKSEDFTAEISVCTGAQTVSTAYAALVAALRAVPGTVVLAFDEVDYITPGSPTNPLWRSEFNPFWRNLRAAYQELSRGSSKLSLLVGGVSSKWFRAEAIDGVENAALAFIPEEYLSPLSSGASIAMIQQLAGTSGLQINAPTADVMAATCSNIPFWIRKAGSFVHRHTPQDSRPRKIEEARMRQLCTAFIEQEGASVAEVAISHLFRVYPELRVVARACIDGDASAHPKTLLAALYKYGIIKTASAYPEISGAMVEAGLRLALDKSDELTQPAEPKVGTKDSLAFGSIDEWAEELAIINGARNRVEKRLRFLVLNFIRVDCLNNNQKPSVISRLTKGLDGRREHIAAMSPDEAIEAFYWLELTNLVEREWTLFTKVFSDKAAFGRHAKIINTRYDAHAKDADKADIAEYRRAVNWLADMLARI